MNAPVAPGLERVTVIVVPRDRHSTTVRCLETLEANTPEPHDLIIVTGGAPARIRREIETRWGGRAALIQEDRFLNPAEGRNLGLRAAKTRLAALVDNDVFVRPGWLGPLVRCQNETGAAMVVPLILEAETVIHTAGNAFYVNYRKGRAYGHKVLLCMKRPYHDRSNLVRRPTDYGELHCQLVEVETALRLGAFDERLREVGEVDSGLTWKKAGLPMWFEPASVVRYSIPRRIEDPDDVRFFAWRWDMRGILEGYRHFERKWDMDVQGQGSFKGFLKDFNNRLGLLPRLVPSRWTLWIDHRLQDVRRLLGNSLKMWGRLKAEAMGYSEWD
jgi:GT2 family glycosyltransferase